MFDFASFNIAFAISGQYSVVTNRIWSCLHDTQGFVGYQRRLDWVDYCDQDSDVRNHNKTRTLRTEENKLWPNRVSFDDFGFLTAAAAGLLALSYLSSRAHITPPPFFIFLVQLRRQKPSRSWKIGQRCSKQTVAQGELVGRVCVRPE